MRSGLQAQRLLPLALAALLAACDAQVGADYPGEPLLTLQGQVVSNGPLPPLEAAMLWQRGPPPSTGDQELATRAPVEAGFPSRFALRLYQPAPEAARRTLAPGEPRYARANAAAVPYGIAVTKVDSLPASGNPGYGIDADHWVVWLEADVRAGSIAEWWLGGAMPAGFHLLRVTAVEARCQTAAALDACVAELRRRGAPDDGTAEPGTARGFCLAPYRLEPATPGEQLVLELGAVGLPTGGACP